MVHEWDKAKQAIYYKLAKSLGGLPMLFLAAAALATDPPPSRTSAMAEATAMVRVMRGAALKLDGSSKIGVAAPRDSMVKAADGSIQHVQVIEFQ